jgi:hypothetical protein
MALLTKIKGFVVILAALAGAAVLLAGDRAVPTAHAFSGGPPPGVAGAPSEVTCAVCHNGPANTGQFSINAPASYAPGQTYQITVVHATNDTTRRSWGFELTALSDGNTRAGAFTATDTTALATGGPDGLREYISHNFDGTFAGSGGGAAWTFNWTAPATDVGNVTFYAAGNQANNNGNSTGDQIYTATRVVNGPPAAPTVGFGGAAQSVNEDANSVQITVTRAGNTATPVTVDYATQDSFSATPPPCHATVAADQRCDYTTAVGTLSFAAGETSKTFDVLINDDAYPEPAETITINLSNPTGGATLGTGALTLTLNDNDAGAPVSNPIDGAQFFARQHYSDFLSRVPDQGGLDFWTGQITQCGADMACINARRIGVSAAFYVELEFQITGYVVYRLYRAAYGTRPPPDQTRVKLDYRDFIPDRAQLVAGPQLEQTTLDLANRFVQRAAFLADYPATQTNAQFVNQLFDRANLTPFTAERQAEIDAMNNQGRTRAQVLLNVINIQAFRDREYNPAFVLMQYFGYLRRDPDQGGYDFWLGLINGQPQNIRGMVCAFLTSNEYQERYSSVSTRNNSLCAGNP